MGDFGKCLGHEDGALTDGISALIKGTPRSSSTFFLPFEDTMERQAVT